MTLPQQDDLSRQRRLNKGCCPVHGLRLVPGEQLSSVQLQERWVWDCPKESCDFSIVPRRGSKCHAALYETGIRVVK